MRLKWWGILIVLCVAIVVAAMLRDYFGKARSLHVSPKCMINLKQIGTGSAMYRQDFGSMPPPERWSEAIDPYVKNKGIFSCPEVCKPRQRGGYAYNSLLPGLRERDITAPDKVVLAFDGPPEPDQFGGPELAVFRHSHMANVVFFDTHVHSFKRVDRLKWDPK